MNTESSFHYPADLFNLLLEAIPRLNKGKKDVFLFFKGAGVPEILMQSSIAAWKSSKDSIGKKDITRQILTAINEHGDKYLAQRREVLKRVTQFDDFSACWEPDQLPAQGLVAKIQKMINAKDTVTRLSNEVDKELAAKRRQREEEIAIAQRRNENLQLIRADLYALFAETNPQKRGKALEGVLNSLFKAYDISVREAFVLRGNEGEGIVEQIDGAVEFDGHLYFVEMKWWAKPLGVAEISEHLVRVYHRSEVRAIIISAMGFTAPAIATCKEALQQKVVTLMTLQEIVTLFEKNISLLDFLRKKINAAIIDKNPCAVGFM